MKSNIITGLKNPLNLRRCLALGPVLIMLVLSTLTYGQSQTFTSTGTFTIPAGVTSVLVECWGGGGSGGGNSSNISRGGGGGAGGAYAKKVVPVISGTVYTVTVAATKAGIIGAGSQGNPSWFDTKSTVYAEGGAGGAAPNGGTASAGTGSAANSIGDVVYAGGSGSTGTTSQGGAGGGGAGSTGAGRNASATTSGGGTVIGGGNGGAGTTVEKDGTNGSTMGGGGGGALIPDATNHYGGNGAAGQVIVTWITLSASSSASIVCSGSNLTLSASVTPDSYSATLLSENLNAATNNWTKINNSTGGTPANAAWTLRADGYNYTSTSSFTFHSNDNSQFYLSNSDAQGSGGTTSTILQSPSMSTVGYTALSLVFYQYYHDYGTDDFAKVQVSTNGSVWTDLATYTTDQGSASGFAKTTINLNSYINNSIFYIRFKYDAIYDWFWAIDNITVSGTCTILNYSWAGAPSGTAGLPSGAGTPSASNASIVVNPTLTTNYRVTVTNPYNGYSTSSSDLAVTVNPLSEGGTASATASTVCSGSTTTINLTGYTGTIQWQQSSNGSTGWANVASGSGATTEAYLTAILNNNTYYKAVVTSGTCPPSNSTIVLVTVISSGTWLGTSSTGWNIASNWCGGIPVAASDVTISSGGNQPEISTAAICNNITINTGGILTIGASGALTVNGALTNNTGNSGLVLLSDSTGTASLIHTTTNVQATMQRYIDGLPQAWHFLSSPVDAQSISGSWLPSGTYGNDLTGYDLYVWNEPTNCWIYKLNTTSVVNWNTVHAGNDFVVGRGYLYSVQDTHPTKEFVGILNTGSVNQALTLSSTNISLKGFNLVGNPYPSSVDWQAASGWTRTNLVASGTGYDMWIWNSAANNYGVINSASGSGTNSVTRYIAPMQGFFVRAGSLGNLGFTNSVRVHDGAGSWLKKGSGADPNIVSVTVKSQEGAGFDEIQLVFGSKENEAGAVKLFSPILSAPSLFMPIKEEKFSVRYLTDTIDYPVVPFMFKPGKDDEYNIQLTFDPYQFEIMILEDRQLHVSQNLKVKNEYTFKASKTDNQSRFALHFTQMESPGNIKLTANIYTEGNQLIIDMTKISLETEVMVCDMMGRQLLRKKLQGEILHTLSLNSKSQLLIVYMKNQKGMICQKLMWINI